MGRRERLERKAERRREWAEKAEARSASASRVAHQVASFIPPGQPILVGHHSEKRHRRDLARIDSNMHKAIENQDLAAHHTSAAAGIEHALDRSIFSDDSNAIEALEKRIAEHEAERERMRTANKLYRKADREGLKALGLDYDTVKAKVDAAYSWEKAGPYPPYQLSNLGGRISTDRKRLGYLKAQHKRAAEAEASPNGIALQTCGEGYVRVTFAEKPDRSVLDALRTAGFSWGAGGWAGKAESLPAEVKTLLELITWPVGLAAD